MQDYRKLSSDEVVALTTINCCSNALRDNAGKLSRRLRGVSWKTALLMPPMWWLAWWKIW